MRRISSMAMAAFVVAALFWGNCFSCPLMLLSLSGHQPAHSCCHRTKSSPAKCYTQDLRNFVKAADAGAAVPALPVMAEVMEPAPALPTPGDFAATPIPAEHAPPDLLSLHSSFRI